MATVAVSDSVLDRLVEICGEEHVFAGKSARFNRARVPSPFPVHRWAEHVPDAVVLPTSAEQISEVVKLANRERIPVVPRAGGTGLTDGAVPLRHGIMVDVKLMNRILELDLEDRTVTVQPGINMLKLSEELKPHGFIYPGRPGLVPVLPRRRADRDERLVADRRPLRAHERPRDQLRDRAPDRRDHPRRRRGREDGAQVVKRLPAQAPLHGAPGNARDRHGSDARARQAARGRVLGLLRLPVLLGRMEGDRRLRPLRRRDAGGGRPLRRVEGRLPPPGRRGLHPAAGMGEGSRGARHVRQRGRGDGPRPSACSGSGRRPGASTWATRSPRATGRRATTATRRRSTAARETARSCQ